MLKADPGRDPLVRQILKWASVQAVSPLAPEVALGTTDRERELLAALGGLACVVSSGLTAPVRPFQSKWAIGGTWPRVPCGYRRPGATGAVLGP